MLVLDTPLDHDGALKHGSRMQTRRRRVTDAARALFCERGFHSTGMAQISDLAGIKIGQIYRDFESKDAIIAAIVEADCADFLDEEELGRAIAASDPAAIRSWVTGLIRHEPASDVRLMPEIFAEAMRNASIENLLQTLVRRLRTSLEEAFASLAPAPSKAAARAALADVMCTVLIGRSQRLLAMPALDAVWASDNVAALVNREIDRLLA